MSSLSSREMFHSLQIQRFQSWSLCEDFLEEDHLPLLQTSQNPNHQTTRLDERRSHSRAELSSPHPLFTIHKYVIQYYYFAPPLWHTGASAALNTNIYIALWYLVAPVWYVTANNFVLNLLQIYVTLFKTVTLII